MTRNSSETQYISLSERVKLNKIHIIQEVLNFSEDSRHVKNNDKEFLQQFPILMIPQKFICQFFLAGMATISAVPFASSTKITQTSANWRPDTSFTSHGRHMSIQSQEDAVSH